MSEENAAIANLFAPDRKGGLVFNKDVATLMEIQRLETLANNYDLMGQSKERFTALKNWASKIKPLFADEDMQELDRLQRSCRQPRQDQVTKRLVNEYSEVVMDKFTDFLNSMMVKHGLQFTRRRTEIDATDAF